MAMANNQAQYFIPTEKPSTCCDTICNKKRWIFLTSFLFAAAVGSIGYIVYTKFFEPKLTEEMLLRKFENILYDDVEIQRMNATENIGRTKTKSQSTNDENSSCRFSCTPNDNYNYAREPRALASTASNELSQGCCYSSRYLVIPNRLTSIDDRAVRAVSIGGRKQAYWEETCRQRANCQGCTCYQMTRQITVLVVDDVYGDDVTVVSEDSITRSRLELVVVPGCCKCLND